MWTRKSLKRGARKSIRCNYIRMVALCIIIAFFTGESDDILSLVRFPSVSLDSGVRLEVPLDRLGGYGSQNVQIPEETSDVTEDSSGENASGDGTSEGDLSDMETFHEKSNSQILMELLASLGYEVSETPKTAATKGVLAGIFNNITEMGSITFGILNMVNQALFQDRIGAYFIILFGGIIIYLYRIFIANILIVGKNRFFLETVTYEHAPVQRILFIYKVKRTRKTAVTMFLREVFLALWSLTIVGGIIKNYSYYMVPYIVAENPDLPWKEVFRLSKQMTRGQKWRLFLFDLSFLGWEILSFLTAGLLGVFLVVPYRNAAKAELYREVRGETIRLRKPGYRGLNDRYLFEEPEQIPQETPAEKIDAKFRMVEYPTQLFTIPEAEWRDWIKTDYDRSYSFLNIVLLFFAFSMIGWFWEVILHIIQEGAIVNRGVLYGPWLPIYGSGGVLILLLMRRFAQKPILTFFLIILVCGVVEYFTGWALETFMHTKWWDYSGFFLNLHGRICAEGLLVFGVGGCAILYIGAPIMDEVLCRIPRKIRTVAAVILLSCFLADMAYSFLCQPNSGEGITETAQLMEMEELHGEEMPPQIPASGNRGR